jgi:hypothetical protein
MTLLTAHMQAPAWLRRGSASRVKQPLRRRPADCGRAWIIGSDGVHYRFRSRRFGRASSPVVPHLVHTMISRARPFPAMPATSRRLTAIRRTSPFVSTFERRASASVSRGSRCRYIFSVRGGGEGARPLGAPELTARSPVHSKVTMFAGALVWPRPRRSRFTLRG